MGAWMGRGEKEQKQTGPVALGQAPPLLGPQSPYLQGGVR